MASSSSTPLTLLAPPSSLPRNWKYHVFPSFHGPDVRKTILSHVVKELKSKGIDLFIDNDIERSKSIGPELVEAIRGSRIAIVLLSKNYTSSTWCLNELVEIIKCRDELGQTVMSIFYQVDPTDIKKQTGDFGKVFEETSKGKTEEDIQRWKHALKEVAQIAGYHSKNWETEAEMIEAIATDVSNKLNLSTPSSDFNSLVGMKSHMTKMEPSLLLGSDESVRKIGIWGPPGIGKTTIARYIFNQYSKDFQTSVFIDNIRRNYPAPACSDDYRVKLDLQKHFMSQVTNDKDIRVPHLGVAKDRLKDKKVLVVLDDVDQSVQVEAMTNEAWVGSGSWIIITSQDQKVLKESRVDHIHEVDLPSFDEALQIFCIQAFGQKIPKDGFMKFACEVTRLVDYLPLGLKVMGSYFRGMSEQDWTVALPKLRSHLDRDGKIASILKFSYDALCDEDKRLFLHIACFFHYEKVDTVEACLEESFLDVTQGLQVLSQKSLISIERVRIEMPKLLIQLGREIVRQEYPTEPGKRQFLNDAKDIAKVLSDDKAGNSSVIGIYLYFDHNKEITSSTCERAFERFSNLQFLNIDGECINARSLNNISRDGECINPRSLNNISRELRVLKWSEFQMTCFPSSFNPEFLVKLEMKDSRLEKLWEGNKPLSNLKSMSLSDSERLKELPDLSTAANLYYLNLSHCSSLVKLSFSIGNAINLQKLNLSGCSSLVKLPSSIGNATNLEKLDLRHCSSLVDLPASMRNLGRLWKLKLEGCSKLEVNLANINLESLNDLDLSGCSLLKSCTESSTEIEELDPWRGRIGRIVLSGMKKQVSLLPLVVGEHLSDWLLLNSYHESSTDIQELVDPWTRGRISGLTFLKLNGMKKLVSLPPLPDSLLYLDAQDCESLERLDCSFGNPIIRLDFANCFKLNQEARDLISLTPTNEYAVFPGREVPLCFTYRSSGSSVTVKLNQTPVGKSAKFKACISLCDSDEGNNIRLLESAPIAKKRIGRILGEEEFRRHLRSIIEDLSPKEKKGYSGSICCIIKSGENSVTYCKKQVEEFFLGHLYTFEIEVETEEITSTELLFDFQLLLSEFITWKVIKECGILPRLEVPLLSFTDYDGL